MARKQETLTFSGALEVQTQKPLDARRRVTLIADLTDAASFPYIYKGLDVFCEENSKWYTFLGGDSKDANNWRMEGSGGGGQDNVIESISVNGIAQAVDANKNVDLLVPTYSKNTAAFAAYDEGAEFNLQPSTNGMTASWAEGTTVVSSELTSKTYVDAKKASLEIATISGGGGGDEISATVSQGTNSVNVNYYKDSELPTALNLNVGADGFRIPTTEYVDGAVTDKTLAPSGWGVARTGIVDIPFSNQTWSTNVPVDISDLGFTSASDYMVFTEPTTGGTTSRWGDAIAFTNNFTATGFTVGVYAPSEMDGVMKVKYTIFAKGYGGAHFVDGTGLPTGGVMGQVLAKRSDTDGDVLWKNVNTDATSVNKANLQGRMVGVYTDDIGGDTTKRFMVMNDSTNKEVVVSLRNAEAELNETAQLYHKDAVDSLLADKQDTLVSGTNIKTLNNMSLLGSGNISIEKGAGIPLDANNLPSTNVIIQMVNDEALVYIDKWMIERVNYDEEHTFWIHTRWGDYTRTYKFLGVEDLDAPLVLEEAAIDNAPTAVHIDTSTTTNYASAQLRAPNGAQVVRIVVHDDYARLEVVKGFTTKTKLLYGGAYKVDKPEGSNAQLGNVVQVGTLLNHDGTELGIFEFYYRTSALANATTKEYTLLPLLQDYNIVDFIDGTGVTSNGIFIGNGRTDGTNYVVIQQFSKNRKAVILRTYQDYSAQTALLKIKFIGTKNA